MAKDKGKVLLTGGWLRMIENLEESLSENYRMLKCGANERDFRFAFEQNRPNVVIVCLSDESGEVSRIRPVLESTIKDGSTPVLIIGHDEECKRLTDGSSLRVVERFGRPLDTALFWSELAKKVEQSQRSEQESLRERAASSAAAVGETYEPELPDDESYSLQDAAAGIPEGYSAVDLELLTPEQKKAEKQLVAQIEMMTTLHGRMTVLVVDDDVRMLNVIKLYLQDLYDVTVVPTGRLAVKFLTQKHADLVLLDYLMPVMDGPAVLKFIREESPCPKIPVLFLTGVSDKERIMTVLDHHPNGYLLKPVTRMILLERVTELLLGLN